MYLKVHYNMSFKVAHSLGTDITAEIVKKFRLKFDVDTVISLGSPHVLSLGSPHGSPHHLLMHVSRNSERRLPKCGYKGLY